MKKVTFTSVLMIVFSLFSFSCTNVSDIENKPIKILTEYKEGPYSIAIFEGASLCTKAETAQYYTLSSDLQGAYSFIAENIVLENSCIIQNHYLETGQLLASLLLDSSGKIVEMIRLPVANAKELKGIITKADDIGECIQEAYDEIEEAIEEHWFTNAACNLFSEICELIKIYLAYLDCCFNR